MNKPDVQTAEMITARFLQVREEVLQSGACKRKLEFAKAVGEHPTNFYAMESGKRSPTLEQLARCCQVFGYSANWLLMETGPKMLGPIDTVLLEERVSKLEKKLNLLERKMRGEMQAQQG